MVCLLLGQIIRSFQRKELDSVGKRFNVGLWNHLIKLSQLGYQREARNLARAQSHRRCSVILLINLVTGCLTKAVQISSLLEELVYTEESVCKINLLVEFPVVVPQCYTSVKIK